MRIANGLIIDKKWIDLILKGEKQWEMRTKQTKFRGWFALACKGQIYGVAQLVDCGEKLTYEQMYETYVNHKIPEALFNSKNFKWFTPWKLGEIRKFETPIAYKTTIGAMIWTDLDNQTIVEISHQFDKASIIKRNKTKALLTKVVMTIKNTRFIKNSQATKSETQKKVAQNKEVRKNKIHRVFLLSLKQ